jgi:hypothetical protein
MVGDVWRRSDTVSNETNYEKKGRISKQFYNRKSKPIKNGGNFTLEYKNNI